VIIKVHIDDVNDLDVVNDKNMITSVGDGADQAF